MAFEKKCERYFEKRNQRIKRLLEKVPQGYNKEDFHQLRVEIKKVRAIAKLATHVTDLDEKRFLKPYHKIFKCAGSVRDTQMAEALLQKERSLKWLQQYRAELKTEARLLEENFYLSVGKNTIRDITHAAEKLKKCIYEIEKKNVKDYLHKEARKLGGIISEKRISTDEAHQLRKKLKRLGYIAKLADGKGGTRTHEVEHLQEELGAWHDHRQLAARLRRDAAKFTDKQKKVHMHNLETIVNARARKMFARISRSLKTMNKAQLKSPTKGEALLF